MVSQELVDRWFNRNTQEYGVIRTEAQAFVKSVAYRGVLDLENPDTLKFSEELILKRHLGMSVLSTHFYNEEQYVNCKVLYLKGDMVGVMDEGTDNVIELLLSRYTNFFSAIRIIEYIEQGKIHINENS